MSIWDKLKDITKDVEKDLANAAAKAEKNFEKDLAEATKIIQDGIAKAKAVLEAGISSVEQEILKSKVEKILDDKDYAADIATLKAALSTKLNSVNTSAVKADIATLLSVSSEGKPAAAAELHTLIDDVGSDLKTLAADFAGVTIGAGGEVDLIVGAATNGSVGAYLHSPTKPPRVIVDFALSAGGEAGADLGVLMGLWHKSPDAIRGGFVAVGVEGTFDAGVGIIVVFHLSDDLEFDGIIGVLTGGAEVKFSLAVGFTASFEVPS